VSGLAVAVGSTVVAAKVSAFTFFKLLTDLGLLSSKAWMRLENGFSTCHIDKIDAVTVVLRHE